MELIDGFDQRALFQVRKRIGLGAFAWAIVYDCDARLNRDVAIKVLRKDRADYIGVKPEGPFKSDHYRY